MALRAPRTVASCSDRAWRRSTSPYTVPSSPPVARCSLPCSSCRLELGLELGLGLPLPLRLTLALTLTMLLMQDRFVPASALAADAARAAAAMPIDETLRLPPLPPLPPLRLRGVRLAVVRHNPDPIPNPNPNPDLTPTPNPNPPEPGPEPETQP